jgi:transcriptional regulator with XRE-family HTH domain
LGPEHAALADALNYLMAKRHLRAEDLAKRSGVSQRNVYNILRCNHTPGLSMIAQLAIALDVQPWQLILTDISPSTATSGELARLITAFDRLAPNARDYLLSVVRFEREQPAS